MQAGTVGDTYIFELYESDGVTAFSTTGASVSIAISNPLGVVSTVIPTVSSNQLQFSTTGTTFPGPGNYQLQAILSYGSGQISKSRVITISISNSLE